MERQGQSMHEQRQGTDNHGSEGVTSWSQEQSHGRGKEHQDPSVTAPQQTAPQQPAPQQPAPQQTVPQQPAPQQPAPQHTAPQQTAPQQPAPQQTAPQQTAPQQTAPQQPAPQQTAPQQPAPQQTAPQQTAPQLPAPQQTAPQQTAPQQPAAPPGLEPLPPSLRGVLRSGVAVGSAAQAVEELVLNAVDAGATCVAVRCDLSSAGGRVQVVDNGNGITRADLSKVANRYTTSKCHELGDLEHLRYFGYRGEALASLREICLILEIESRAKGSAQTFTRQFKKGQNLGTLESKDPRPCPGTTVTVYDVFHKLPVRKKALNESLELERCRQRMEAFALIHPKISFSLRNDATNQVVLQTHKSNSVLGSFTHLFGVPKARNLCEVKTSREQFDIAGYISTEGCSNKNFQFVYINSRLVLKTKIHKYMNFWLSRSKIGKRRGLKENDKKTRSAPGSPQKKPEKHGIYVLNVTCALSEYDITFDPSKTLVEFKAWSVLLSGITDMVREFLVRENLVNKEENSSSSSDELSDVEKAEEVAKVEITKEQSTVALDPSKYARGISALDIENALHSKAARRPVNHAPAEKEDLDDVLPPSQDEVTMNEEVLPETPNQTTTKQDIDTLDIHASQFTADVPGELLANAVEAVESGSNNLNAKVTRDENSLTIKVPDELQTPYNPIPSLTVSQLMPMDSPSPQTQGIRDKTFISLPSSDDMPVITKDRDRDRETPWITTQTSSAVTRDRETPWTQETTHANKDFETGETSQTSNSSVEAFKAAFNKRTSQPSETQVALAPLQRIRQRLIAKADRRKSAQGNKSDATSPPTSHQSPPTSTLGMFKKHSDAGKHKNRMMRKRSAEDTTTPSPSAACSTNLESPGSNIENAHTVDASFNSTFSRPQPDDDADQLSTSVSSLSAFRSSYAAANANPARKMLTSLQKLRQKLVAGQLVETPDEPASKRNKEQEAVANPVQNNTEKVQRITLQKSDVEQVTETNENKRKTIGIVPSSIETPNPQVCVQRVSSYQETSNHKSMSKLPNSSSMKGTSEYTRQITFNALDLFQSPLKDESKRSNREKMSPTVQALDVVQNHCHDLTQRKRSSSYLQSFQRSSTQTIPFNTDDYTRQIQEAKMMRLSTSQPKQKPETKSYLSSDDLVQTAHRFFTKKTSSQLRSHDQHIKQPQEVAKTSRERIQNVYEKHGLERNDLNVSSEEFSFDSAQLGSSSYFSRPFTNIRGHVNRYAHLLEDVENVEQESTRSKLIQVPENITTVTEEMHSHRQSPTHESTIESNNQMREGRKTGMPNSVPSIGKEATTIVSITRASDRTEIYHHENTTDNTMTVEPRNQINWPRKNADGPEKKVGFTRNKVNSARNEDAQNSHISTFPSTQQFLPESSQGFTAVSPIEDTQAFEVKCWTPDKASCSTHRIAAPEQDQRQQTQNGIKSAAMEMPGPKTSMGDRDTTKETKDIHKELWNAGNNQRSTSKDHYTSNTVHRTTDTRPTEPTELTDLTEPTKPTKPSEPTDPTAPTEPTEPTKPTKPTAPTQPTAPTESTKPTVRTDPTKPTQPSTPTEPTESIDLPFRPSAKALSCAAVTDTGRIQVHTPPLPGCTDAMGDWIQQTDSTGQTIYINTVTGNSSFVAPQVTTDIDTSAELKKVPYGVYGNNASTFLPSKHPPGSCLPQIRTDPKSTDRTSGASAGEIGRMLTDHLKSVHAEGLEKWGDDGPPIAEKRDVADVITKLWNEWENPMFKNPGSSCKSLEKSDLPQDTYRVQQLIHPYTFTTDIFSRIKVLGQMDKKFIACLVPPSSSSSSSASASSSSSQSAMLIVVDQHAAHERVRLEKFTQAAYEGEGGRLKASLVSTPVDVALPASTLRIMQAYTAYFDRIGIRFSIGEGSVSLQTLPTCLLDAESSETKRAKHSVPYELVEILLKEQVEVVEESHGADITLPRVIHNRLCSQACHGAIRFGDPLSMKECEELIEQLSRCRLPFQCAHGRPACMPLLNMDHLHFHTAPRNSQVKTKTRTSLKILKMMEEYKRERESNT